MIGTLNNIHMSTSVKREIAEAGSTSTSPPPNNTTQAASVQPIGINLGVALNSLNTHEKESIKKVEAIYRTHLEQLQDWKRHQIRHIHTTFQQYRQSFFGESLPQPSWTPTPLVLPNASAGTSHSGTNALSTPTRDTPTIILTSKSGSLTASRASSPHSHPPPLETEENVVLQSKSTTNQSFDNCPARPRKRTYQKTTSSVENESASVSDIVRAVKKRRLKETEEKSRSLSILSLSSDSDSSPISKLIGHNLSSTHSASSGYRTRNTSPISISSSTSPSPHPSRGTVTQQISNNNRTKGVELLLAAADHFEAVKRSKSTSAFSLSNSLFLNSSHGSSRSHTPFVVPSKHNSVQRRTLPSLETLSHQRSRGSGSSVSMSRSSESGRSVSPTENVQSRSRRDVTCIKCGKRRGGMSKSNWERHLQAIHRHECYLCHRSFTKKLYLSEHLASTHELSEDDCDPSLLMASIDAIP